MMMSNKVIIIGLRQLGLPAASYVKEDLTRTDMILIQMQCRKNCRNRTGD
jgi:hypothetical protein